MLPLVYVDCETTGLDSELHEMYELSLRKDGDDGDTIELYYWINPERLALASPEALKIGRFHERQAALPVESHSIIRTEKGRAEAAERVARFTADVHLVGAKPSFDAGFMQAFLWANGQVPLWHHRMIDVESMVIGFAPERAEGRPMGLKDLCEYLGVELDPETRHTATGDCEAVQKVYKELTENRKMRVEQGP